MFGLQGKLKTQSGKRQQLVDHLLQAAEILQTHDGCYLYVISEDPMDEDTVMVTEVWRSSEDHQASLTLDAVKNLIAAARPILAGAPEGVVMHPVGGKGLPR
jgi:quinol monooxygenase YgiN